jgi:hypothetical protein
LPLRIELSISTLPPASHSVEPEPQISSPCGTGQIEDYNWFGRIPARNGIDAAEGEV